MSERTSPKAEPGDVQKELVQFLLDRIRADKYPSTTMMDMVESVLEPDMVQPYARVLMQKAADDTYPSMEMLNRVRGLT